MRPRRGADPRIAEHDQHRSELLDSYDHIAVIVVLDHETPALKPVHYPDVCVLSVRQERQSRLNGSLYVVQAIGKAAGTTETNVHLLNPANSLIQPRHLAREFTHRT